MKKKIDPEEVNVKINKKTGKTINKKASKEKVKTRCPRINIFQGGKVNILGAESIDSANLIYNFIVDIFKYNWDKCISIKPKKDKDRLLSKLH